MCGSRHSEISQMPKKMLNHILQLYETGRQTDPIESSVSIRQ